MERVPPDSGRSQKQPQSPPLSPRGGLTGMQRSTSQPALIEQAEVTGFTTPEMNSKVLEHIDFINTNCKSSIKDERGFPLVADRIIELGDDIRDKVKGQLPPETVRKLNKLVFDLIDDRYFAEEVPGEKRWAVHVDAIWLAHQMREKEIYSLQTDTLTANWLTMDTEEAVKQIAAGRRDPTIKDKLQHNFNAILVLWQPRISMKEFTSLREQNQQLLSQSEAQRQRMEENRRTNELEILRLKEAYSAELAERERHLEEKNNLQQQQYRDLQELLDKKEAESKQVKGELAAQRDEVHNLTQRNSQLQKEIENQKTESEKATLALKKDVENLKTQTLQLQQTIQAQEQSLAKQKEQLSTDAETSKRQHEEQNKKLSELESQNAKQKENEQMLIQENIRLQEERNLLLQKLQNIDANIEQRKNDLQELTTKLQVLVKDSEPKILENDKLTKGLGIQQQDSKELLEDEIAKVKTMLEEIQDFHETEQDRPKVLEYLNKLSQEAEKTLREAETAMKRIDATNTIYIQRCNDNITDGLREINEILENADQAITINRNATEKLAELLTEIISGRVTTKKPEIRKYDISFEDIKNQRSILQQETSKITDKSESNEILNLLSTINKLKEKAKQSLQKVKDETENVKVQTLFFENIKILTDLKKNFPNNIILQNLIEKISPLDVDILGSTSIKQNKELIGKISKFNIEIDQIQNILQQNIELNNVTNEILQNLRPQHIPYDILWITLPEAEKSKYTAERPAKLKKIIDTREKLNKIINENIKEIFASQEVLQDKLSKIRKMLIEILNESANENLELQKAYAAVIAHKEGLINRRKALLAKGDFSEGGSPITLMIDEDRKALQDAQNKYARIQELLQSFQKQEAIYQAQK